MARQQARISTIEKEIKEAKDAQHIEPLLASTKGPHMAQQDTDEMQDIAQSPQEHHAATGITILGAEMPATSVLAQAQTDCNLQHSSNSDVVPQPDTEMHGTDGHTDMEAAQQSMWL